ncbi:SGNH/GDSL hydrolase family protein [Nakamurella endophytica]|uniref:Lipase n=1 Tax=Nakamurella endophytica TaxID=1748367 RepID=A0A917WDC8_9ACTN|nr:SGNH/GDSL hydrolase family protein [Nakamurella endophytica]GGL92524.1 lipase [Nakamurella endophytica]
MRYVAIGDSFTEGVGDERPDGTPRGWADRVAAGLAAAGEPVQYANLAIRGRLLEPIVTDQLEAALSLDPLPTLLSFNGGGNDMLRPRADMARLARWTEQAVRRCLDAGVEVLLLSGADPSDRLPFGRAVRRRGEELTAAVRELSARDGIRFVDMFHDTEIRRPGYWSADRIHLGPAGHQRVAEAVLAALGHPAAPGDAVAAGSAPPPGGVRTELRYYRSHVLPWVRRRLRGTSSGDTRLAKHPDWVTVDPA